VAQSARHTAQGEGLFSNIENILVITDLGELDFYQAQAIVGARMVPHKILILQGIFA
jgi:hypothetical protein